MQKGIRLYGNYRSKNEAWNAINGELLDLFWYLKRSEIEKQGGEAMEVVQVAATAIRYLQQYWSWPDSSSPSA